MIDTGLQHHVLACHDDEPVAGAGFQEDGCPPPRGRTCCLRIARLLPSAPRRQSALGVAPGQSSQAGRLQRSFTSRRSGALSNAPIGQHGVAEIARGGGGTADGELVAV